MSLGVEEALRVFLDEETARLPASSDEALLFLELESGSPFADPKSSLVGPLLWKQQLGTVRRRPRSSLARIASTVSGHRSRVAATAVVSGLAFAAMLAIGLWRIQQPSPWRDEAVTLAVVRRSPGQIVHLAEHVDAVLTPYYLLMHFVTPAPHSLFALRLASALFVASAAAGLVWLGRLVGEPGRFGLRVGGWAAAVFIADPLTSRYAQEARPYALAMLLSVVSACLLVKWLLVPSRRWLAWYVTATVVLGYTQLLALLVLPAHGVSVALARGRPAVRRWLLACAVGGCAVAPLGVYAWQERFAMAWHTKPAAAQLQAVIDELGGNEIGFHLLLLALALGLAVAYFSWRRSRRDPSLGLVLGGLWLLLPPFLLFGWSQISPMFSDRYVMFCVPALCLLAGLGLALTPWPAAAGMAALFANFLLPMQRGVRSDVGHNEDVRGVARAVAATAQPGDAVVFVPSDRRVVEEAYPHDFSQTVDVLLDRRPDESGSIAGVEVSPAAVPAAILSHSRVITVGTATATNAASVDHAALDVLTARYKIVERRRFTGFTLTIYARS